jgi:hypothetical protein
MMLSRDHKSRHGLVQLFALEGGQPCKHSAGNVNCPKDSRTQADTTNWQAAPDLASEVILCGASASLPSSPELQLDAVVSHNSQ